MLKRFKRLTEDLKDMEKSLGEGEASIADLKAKLKESTKGELQQMQKVKEEAQHERAARGHGACIDAPSAEASRGGSHWAARGFTS